jgi:hypothetical protein
MPEAGINLRGFAVKRLLLGLALLSAASCAESTAPSTLYSSYDLASVDGQPLPVPWLDDGTTLTGIVLEFTNERTRRAMAPEGVVQYRLTVRRPDHSIEHSEIGLNYQIRGNELRIDLCPPLALCITTTELVGTIGEPIYELVLTNYTGGVAGSVYRFVRVLPE